MSHGCFNQNGNPISYGFSSVRDWFDSVIESFPAPWIIGDNTHYGTEIFDSRGMKVLSVWMAWGNPSDRQRGDMSDSEWIEFACDSHWESETQWHIANAIVTTRNYLKAHKERGWYGDDDVQRYILRNLIMAYACWKEPIDSEIACGGPDRRMTSSEAERVNTSLRVGSDPKWAKMHRDRETNVALEKLKSAKPTVATNPKAAEAQNLREALWAAMFKMIEERPPVPLELGNGLTTHHTLMDSSYLERLAELAEQEYDEIKKRSLPTDASAGSQAASPEAKQ